MGISKTILSAMLSFMLFNVSAYTAADDETGRGDGLTASGVYAEAGRTIAADHLPFGTRVIIYDVEYVVQDRFGGDYTDRIDIYMNTKEEAWEWGRKWIVAEVIPSE